MIAISSNTVLDTFVLIFTHFNYSFFFESVTWDETGVGFEHVPGGSKYANRSVISWHFYIPPMASSSSLHFCA